MRSLIWFVMGAVAGAILSACVAAGLMLALAESGVQVSADLGHYPQIVGNAIRDEVAGEITAILKQVEDEVSRTVSQQTAGTLGASGIVVYGVEIPLPPEATRLMEDALAEILARELAYSLSNWPWDEMVEAWVMRAEKMIEDVVATNLTTMMEVDLGIHRSLPAIPVHLRLEAPTP